VNNSNKIYFFPTTLYKEILKVTKLLNHKILLSQLLNKKKGGVLQICFTSIL